ncbi:MAG: hypothetical protein IK031_07295 [Bacteroidales bacterium]|nr:hypothetical protein [Bacteroidales bacterium]
MYKVLEVKSKSDLRRFIRFPDVLYRGCAQYVPALHSSEMHALTAAASLSYCKRRCWLAVDGSKVVGRICAIINPRYNELYGKKRVRFGWFDCINELEVAKLLIGAAEDWARSEGMTEIHGPLSYNTMGRQGMLVEGYENIPPFNCIYNFPYYNDLMTALGFEKECDWLQYKMVANHGVPEKARRVAKMVMERYNLHLGSIDALKKDPAQVRKFFKVYNDSFSQSVYNFIPLTDKEIEEEASAMMRFISDKASSILLDENGDLVAFGISTPSLSKAMQKARGHLFPFGWYFLRRAMKNYKVTDLMVNGAAPEWQNKGVSSVYYKEMADKAAILGNRWAISNPQIESNSAVNIWNSYEHDPYMRRRCYIKKIGE